jgi:hypothetical protein
MHLGQSRNLFTPAQRFWHRQHCWRHCVRLLLRLIDTKHNDACHRSVPCNCTPLLRRRALSLCAQLHAAAACCLTSA